MSYSGPPIRETSGLRGWMVTVTAKDRKPYVARIEAKSKAQAIRRMRPAVAKIDPPMPADYYISAKPASQVSAAEVLL